MDYLKNSMKKKMETPLFIQIGNQHNLKRAQRKQSKKTCKQHSIASNIFVDLCNGDLASIEASYLFIDIQNWGLLNPL